jgi:hypothetical protein
MEKSREELINEEIQRKDFFVDSIIFCVKFLIAFFVCLIFSSPFILFLHLFNFIELGLSFWHFGIYDFYIISIVNIIFWIRISLK